MTSKADLSKELKQQAFNNVEQIMSTLKLTPVMLGQSYEKNVPALLVHYL